MSVDEIKQLAETIVESSYSYDISKKNDEKSKIKNNILKLSREIEKLVTKEKNG